MKMSDVIAGTRMMPALLFVDVYLSVCNNDFLSGGPWSPSQPAGSTRGGLRKLDLEKKVL